MAKKYKQMLAIPEFKLACDMQARKDGFSSTIKWMENKFTKRKGNYFEWFKI